MSQEPDIKRDDPMIAAEWALGLLEGEELLAARGKYATDPDFAWRKEWWDDWFAPMTDTIPGAEPSPQVWDGIAARIAGPAAATAPTIAPATQASTGNVVALQASVRRWQWVAGIASMAAAVALALVLSSPLGPPAAPPTQIAAAAPLVATVPIGDTGLRLDVTYIPQSERMVVKAIGLTADGVHDHELWLVPADGGALQSLGVVAPGTVRSITVSDSAADALDDGASLVLTREPIGGKPDGVSAGPVVAQGDLSSV